METGSRKVFARGWSEGLMGNRRLMHRLPFRKIKLWK